VGARHILEDHLVHAHGRSQDPGPYVGNAGQLQKALNGPVLTVGAVQYRKGDVDLANLNGLQRLLLSLGLQAHQPALRRLGQ